MLDGSLVCYTSCYSDILHTQRERNTQAAILTAEVPYWPGGVAKVLYVHSAVSAQMHCGLAQRPPHTTTGTDLIKCSGTYIKLHIYCRQAASTICSQI